MNTEFIHSKHCTLNDNTLCEYFFKKSLFFNELARFGQFIEYTLFRSPFLLPKVPIWSPFHSKSSPHLVPILKKLGPHSIPFHFDIIFTSDLLVHDIYYIHCTW